MALRELFRQQQLYLNHFFTVFPLQEAERAFEAVKHCAGSIILSGVGKSGLIAQKISATLVSTGTRASFLSPGNALHGDVGAVTSSDVVLAISKSGETQELLDLIPVVQRKGAQTIAFVSSIGSRLEKLCDLTVHLPVLRELCPYDLAPTTSTAVQLLFGDVLAIALMQVRGFSVSDFAANHPAGLLGRKITLKVSDLMLKGKALPLCRPSDRLIDVLHELTAKKCGCLLVIDEEAQLQGIFTDGDLRRSIEKKGPQALEMAVSALMTGVPKSIEPSKLALEAVRTMEEDPARLITVLPVLEGRQVIGLIRMHDIIQSGLH
ncbi:MAG: KpsF/GutQ family sugar-phosphate isomerase [Verrucomicrobiota bacterium]|nr:KpsF/GutQ family sugar-phosphate isomerase [Verrucomicrobiota bacterium]